MALVYSFATFIALFVLVGAVSARVRRHSSDDYLLASRQMGPMYVGLSGMASTVSGLRSPG